MKIIKRGLRNYINDLSIFYNKKKHTIKLHFDMHHGYGVLDKAIDSMNNKDKNEFRKFVSIKKWFNDLFKWLFTCEKIFGLKKLKGYDQQRLYAYLAERYLSFWFKKYTKVKTCPWVFYNVKAK